MEEAQLRFDYLNLERVLQQIPPEILFRYSGKSINNSKEI